ncbi:MAG: DUF3800 domain-containing protein [Caldilinea sp.]
MSQKLCCYVDESGQDTNGEFFIVAIVVVGGDRERLRQRCIDIEAQARKGVRKWAKSNRERRLAYIQSVLGDAELRGRLHFAFYRFTQDYLAATVQTISLALHRVTVGEEYKATVLIDGLSRADERKVGLLLRCSGMSVQKVRGIDDESEPLIRLADAICGFTRSAFEEDAAMHALFVDAVDRGMVVKMGGK